MLVHPDVPADAHGYQAVILAAAMTAYLGVGGNRRPVGLDLGVARWGVRVGGSSSSIFRGAGATGPSTRWGPQRQRVSGAAGDRYQKGGLGWPGRGRGTSSLTSTSRSRHLRHRHDAVVVIVVVAVAFVRACLTGDGDTFGARESALRPPPYGPKTPADGGRGPRAIGVRRARRADAQDAVVGAGGTSHWVGG